MIFNLFGISLVYYEKILMWSPADNKKTMSNSNIFMRKQVFILLVIEISRNAQQNRLHNHTREGSSMAGKPEQRSLQNYHS